MRIGAPRGPLATPEVMEAIRIINALQSLEIEVIDTTGAVRKGVIRIDGEKAILRVSLK
jgi:hypothetical protein